MLKMVNFTGYYLKRRTLSMAPSLSAILYIPHNHTMTVSSLLTLISSLINAHLWWFRCMPQDKLACQNRADQRELAAEIWRDNAVDLEWLVRHEKLTLELNFVLEMARIPKRVPGFKAGQLSPDQRHSVLWPAAVTYDLWHVTFILARPP